LAPTIVTSSALGKDGFVAPSDRITMAFLGMGTMGDGHLWGRAWTYLPGGYIARDDVQVLAVCDVWRNKREEHREKVNQYYSQKFAKGDYKSCLAYRDFRDILARPDIDAVLIATPNHWHATMSVMAAQSGKDVYCEKPTAVTIQESQAMVKAFKENQRIFQAGTQQRSEYGGKFRTACEMIRNNRIGDVESVFAYRDGGGVIWSAPEGEAVPVPEDLDWDLWLGPAPMVPYQGKTWAHMFGFGGINWGQHHYDLVQWALGTDHTGPVEVGVDEQSATYRYADDTIVYGRPLTDVKIGETGGGWFIGTKGRIGVDRENLIADPPTILDRPPEEQDIRLYRSDGHSKNFLECVKSRKKAICDVETSHRAVSVLLLGGIAKQLKRSLRWDPQQERFPNDEEANGLMSLPKRSPWRI
jgi:predicted dehydrogenase